MIVCVPASVKVLMTRHCVFEHRLLYLSVRGCEIMCVCVYMCARMHLTKWCDF